MSAAVHGGKDGLHDGGLARFDADRLAGALIGGRQHAANEVLDAWIGEGFRYEEIAVRGIQPALYRIGRLWERGDITVAEEHLATAIAQTLLVRAFEAAAFARPRSEKALFACVADNHHELGSRIVSDTFAIAGWDVQYLGANVPTGDLVQRVAAVRPRLVGLSVSLPEHVATANAAIAGIQRALGDRAPRIVVGGLAVQGSRHGRPALAADRVDGEVWPVDATEVMGRL